MVPFFERKRPLVLAVDDDRSERFLLSAALERDGFTVEPAADGREALSLFASIQPDIVLLDVDMPHLDGFETCRAMRAQMEGRRIPILMVTGLTDEGSIDLAYEAGATDFITKPLNWPLLGRRVRYMLRAARVSRENEALLRALPDTIYHFGADGTLQETTHDDDRPGIFEVEAPLGCKLHELLPAATADLWLAAKNRAELHKHTERIELNLTKGRFAGRAFEVRIEPLGKGETLAIVRDVTGLSSKILGTQAGG